MKRLLYGLLICTTLSNQAITPYISIRSQSRDKVREIVGLTNEQHVVADRFWATLSALAGFTQTFQNDDLTKCLFGSQAIAIQGSAVPNRLPYAWLADYFYLPNDYEGTITFDPQVRNILIDLDFYMGLDCWLPGLYFRAFAPIVNSRWNLRFCEQAVTGTADYTAGYFAPSEIPSSSLLSSFQEYITGNQIDSVDGIQFLPLRFAKMEPCGLRKTSVADFRMELGWQFLLCDDYYLGLNIQAAAPTGNQPRADFVFNPVVGNGNHWEFGAGLIGGYTWVFDEAEEYALGIHLDANFTHLFNSVQQRTFDLKGKPNSRYMLIHKLQKQVVDELGGGDISQTLFAGTVTPALRQFTNQVQPLANLSSIDVKVHVGVQADIVAWMTYEHCNISWDLGYNFWGTSCENIKVADLCGTTTTLCDGSQENMWALKGDAHLFGFATVTAGGLTAGESISLSPSQIEATIHHGTNATTTSSIAGADPVLTNAGVDNAQFAYAGTNQQRLVYSPTVANNEENHIQTSIQPIFINCCDLNFQPTRGLSHKVFTHLAYHWTDICYEPFAGIGGFAEFGQNKQSNDCSSCVTCSLSQWGVWIKAGMIF